MRPNASHRKYEIDELSFSNINKDNCYWAGFIAADGNISGINLSVELNSIDEKHLLKLADFVRSNIGIYKRKRQRDFEEIEYSCFKIRSQIIINDLYDNFNIVPRKSLILEPPKISGNFIKHYIRGYFDGDGCIGFDTHFKLTFVGGSFNILKWIKENIEQAVETGDPTICVRDKSKTYCLSYHGNQVINILNWLYEDCGNNFLNRKKDKYESFIGGLI